MHPRRSILNRIVRIRNIKIALLIQSLVTTCAVIYVMFQTSTLDQASRLELDLSDARCRGCCVMQNDTMLAISNEPRLSEKLHKFSRAIRKYDIPEDVMKILHNAEHKIEEFEIELKKFKDAKINNLSQLQRLFIEEDIGVEQELVPKSKPKWTREKSEEKPVSKPVSNTFSISVSKLLSKQGYGMTNVNAATKIPNDIHNEIVINVPA